jgi:peptidoglycan/LPS O-acetylase OafA/YrhL
VSQIKDDPLDSEAANRHHRPPARDVVRSLPHRPEIDGMRALSVVAVVLFHANLGLPGGYIGVDVFFVISGFLITSLILKDLDAGQFSIAEFWERRIRRIFPALAVMVAVVLVTGYWMLLPDPLVGLGKSAIAQSLFLANVYFWHDVGYFAAPAAQKPLLHTWSLAVEEQFYLLFPLVLTALGQIKRRYLLTVLVSIALLSFAAGVYGTYRYPSASFFLLPTRAWELLAGSLLVFIPKTMRLPKAANEVGASLGIGAILLAAFTYDSQTRFPGLAAILPVVGAAAFIFANTHQATIIGRLLSFAPFGIVGKMSYSLYLWHWPILAFLTCVRGDLGDPLTSWSAVSLSFIVATISWHFVERPFRRRSVAPRRSLAFACAGTVQALFIAASVFFWTTSGFPSRHSAELKRMVSDIECRNTQYESFINELETAQLPVVGQSHPPDGTVDFALFGDSHAVALAPLFDTVCKRHHLTGLVIAKRGVSPLPRTEDVGKRNELFLETLARRRIKNVFIVARWDSYVTDAKSIGDLTTMLKSMELRGVERVFLFRQVPCQPLGDSFSQHLLFSFRFPAFVNLRRTSAAAYRQQYARENSFFEKCRDCDRLEVELIDTAAGCFDQAGYCRVLESGRALYFDDDHVSNVGAEVLLNTVVDSVFSRM